MEMKQQTESVYFKFALISSVIAILSYKQALKTLGEGLFKSFFYFSAILIYYSFRKIILTLVCFLIYFKI